MPNKIILWTPEQQAFMREQWETGAKCATIAQRLNEAFPGRNFTTNAVIGQARHLNLPTRRRTKEPGGKVRRVYVREYKPKPRSEWIQQHIPITVDDIAHTLVKGLVDLCNERRISSTKFCGKVGISEGAWLSMRRGYSPKLDILEAGYNVFGKTLIAVDKQEPERNTNDIYSRCRT